MRFQTIMITEELIDQFRDSSRRVVRELGFLQNDYRPADVSHSQCHALIEINKVGMIGVAALAESLQLDKSTTSRVVHSLKKQGLIKIGEHKDDKRFKPISLTTKGETKLQTINTHANQQTSDALGLLSDADLEKVIEGMRLYASALNRSKQLAQYTIRPIEKRDNEAVAMLIVNVMTEFGAVGDGFSIQDDEVKNMYDAYANERAAYFVLSREDKIVGGGGIGPLPGAEDDICELKKMYFYNDVRGLGLGQKLIDICLYAARQVGYKRCYLETLKHMTQAKALYQKNQFLPIDKPLGSTGHFGCDAWMVKDL
ncbi:MAG: MarR family transcriptional regulator [Calditrichaeota bacterium]|nr:MarR family transcriptional regulator [Calditrichota bacterium]